MCFDRLKKWLKNTKLFLFCSSCIVRTYFSPLSLVQFEIIPFYTCTSGFTASTKWEPILKLFSLRIIKGSECKNFKKCEACGKKKYDFKIKLEIDAPN